MSKNKIKSLSEHAFRDSVKIDALDLSHNRIDDPDIIEVFEKMKNLVNNLISLLSDTFFLKILL